MFLDRPDLRELSDRLARSEDPLVPLDPVDLARLVPQGPLVLLVLRQLSLARPEPLAHRESKVSLALLVLHPLSPVLLERQEPQE